MKRASSAKLFLRILWQHALSLGWVSQPYSSGRRLRPNNTLARCELMVGGLKEAKNRQKELASPFPQTRSLNKLASCDQVMGRDIAGFAANLRKGLGQSKGICRKPPQTYLVLDRSSMDKRTLHISLLTCAAYCPAPITESAGFGAVRSKRGLPCTPCCI